MTRPLAIGITLSVLWAGCRSDVLGIPTDGGSVTRRCDTGDEPSLNGVTLAPAQIVGTGHTQMACCNELGSISFVMPPKGMTVPELRLDIGRFVGTPLTTPVHVDVAPLPKDWILSLRYSECLGTGSDPCHDGAAEVDGLISAHDQFTGSFDVSGPEGARVLSVCIEAAAKTPADHPLLRSAHLVAHDVKLPRSF